MASTQTDPVVLVGRSAPSLSRWLWLVKWLLLVPHVILLFFLWIALILLTVVAWFSIVFTGRYPRPIFAFNLGVLRWSWRVLFYGYGALGTDRYPPFSLGPHPEYPASLDIAYPDALSRGLVWVKSWLLAIPHYLVLGFFFGAGGIGSSERHTGWPASSGLLGLLVLFLGVLLLFVGRFPPAIFDLVMGMNRWGARVAAYALLMTDAYPPLRLEQGGEEQVHPEPGPPEPGPPEPEAGS